MKAFLATTAVLFGLLALAHVWRIVAEWPALLTSGSAQIEAVIGLIAAALCVWAVRLLRSLTARQS